MKKNVLSILSSALLCAALFTPVPADLAADLQQLIDDSEAVKRGNIALRVADPESGEILFDYHGTKLLTPASVLKLYTSACALAEFGPTHTFETTVGISGFLQEDALSGDLVLRGGGDPMLKTEDLREIAAKVREDMGISSISGGIVVDISLFDSPLKGPGWMWDDDPDDYNMSITAIMANFNVLNVLIMPDGRIRLDPPATYPPLRNDLVKGQGETSIDVIRNPFEEEIYVRGVIGPDMEEPARRALTMHDPAEWVGSVFRTMLMEEGITIEDFVKVSRRPSGVEPIIRHPSVPLSEAIRHFNKTSENAVGEMLLHQLAIQNGHVPATWTDGATEITKWLTTVAGVPEGSFRLVDGSGLSRYNLISAESTVVLLSYMYGHRDYETYRESLPVYNVEAGGEEVPAISAKPGGMSGVATYGGYVTTKDGETLVFSLLGNGYVASNQDIVNLRHQVFARLYEGLN